MTEAPLFKPDYKAVNRVYPIEKPEIVSGPEYYFVTDSNLHYQVTFGKKKNNYLGNIVNFSVIDEEFEDEYSETNHGEVFGIIATMIEIVRLYHQAHPYSNSYEFSGEYKDGEDESGPSIRTRLFLRAIRQVVDMRFWKIMQEDNKVSLLKIPRND